MNLDDWAYRWKIAPEALHDLRMRIGCQLMPALAMRERGTAASESRVQAIVRIEAANMGIWLTRNNVGALLDERGVPVRYGLANESKAQNVVVKSGDLIGIRSVLVGPQHVGRTIGQFVSREIKHSEWKWSGDKHEVAQLNWANFVLSKGGDAAFCCGPGSFNQQE